MIYVVRMEHARVEMWIHIGSDFSSQDESSSIHQHFLTKKKEIESAYGGPLNWNHEGRKTAFSIQQDYNDFKLNEFKGKKYFSVQKKSKFKKKF